MKAPIPPGKPPTITVLGSGRFLVEGDPRGPNAHPMCSDCLRKIYRNAKAAASCLEDLQRAFQRRTEA